MEAVSPASSNVRAGSYGSRLSAEKGRSRSRPSVCPTGPGRDSHCAQPLTAGPCSRSKGVADSGRSPRPGDAVSGERGGEQADLRALMRRYRNRPMSLANACLVRLSELQTDGEVFTLDSDFRIYRRHGNKVIPVLTAVENAKAFGPIQGRTELDVKYHFVLVDTTSSVLTSRTVKRGNALERAVLRMFGIKTEKVVLDYRCQEDVPQANDVRLAGAVIEVRIYGRTRCLQTQAATLTARR